MKLPEGYPCQSLVTAKVEDGSTPLHVAVLNESVDLSRLLTEYGADMLAQDNDGSTPLELALKMGREDLLAHRIWHTVESWLTPSSP